MTEQELWDTFTLVADEVARVRREYREAIRLQDRKVAYRLGGELALLEVEKSAALALYEGRNR